MRTISPALLAHCRGSVLTLATFWRLTRRDGLVLGFTNFDQPLTIDGVTYDPETGIAPTSLALQSNQAVANANLAGVLNSDRLTEEDLESGRWAGAEVLVFLANWADTSMGTIPLLKGEVGQVKLNLGATFDIEVRALGSRLQQQIGDVDTRTCPAKDCTCLSELAELPENTVEGVVDSVLYGNRIFLGADRTEAADFFRYGKLTWLTGENAGLSQEVFDYQPGSVALVEAMPRPINAGDTYKLSRGVDGELETCKSFGNTKRFAGFPYILGPESLLSTVKA